MNLFSFTNRGQVKIGRKLIGVCGFALITLVMGCTQPITESNEAADGGADVKGVFAQSPVLSTNYNPDTIVAEVDGQKITRQELENSFRTMLAVQQARGQEIEPVQLQQMKVAVLDMLIDSNLVYQFEVRNYPEVPTERIDKALDELKLQYGSDEAFYSHIMERGVTTESLKATAEIDIRNQMFMERLFEKAAVTEEEASSIYNANKEMFRVPEQIDVSHLLVALKHDADVESERKAFERAQGLLAKLKSDGGPSFEALVREFSDDEKTKNDGGAIGSFFITDKTPEGAAGEIYKIVEPLAEGAISTPIRTEIGVHILKVTSRKPAHLSKLEEVQKDIMEQIRRQKAMELRMAKIQELHAAADIKKYSISDMDSVIIK